jgi:periplasmic protein TonB
VAKTSLVYGVSFLVHGGLAVGVIALRPPEHRETIAISMSEAKKKTPEPAKVVEDPRPVEPRTEAPRPRARATAPAPKADAPPPDAAPKAAAQVLEGLPELGISLGNGGPGGIAVPQGAPAAEAPASSAHAPPKVLAPRAAADECSEPVVKPKRRLISQPAYTSAAQEAHVEGLLRVEVTVGPDGSVTGARVVSGLGYGLDEAALAAARRASFEPATRCGKPVAGTAVLPFRFNMQ